MRRRNILALLLALTLLLPGCGGARTGGGEEARLTILASTYPVYLAARAVTDGVDGVAVERLNTGEVSCLHDYTLTVTDMKKIETADVIALNGADLEEFMEDALAASSALVIDCSEGVSLLENADHVHTEGDDGHDHGHYDPHYWMDPDNMVQMVENLYTGLNQADPDHQEQYQNNAQAAAAQTDLDRCIAAGQSLRVGIGADEINALNTRIDHMHHSVTACAAHTHDLDDRAATAGI